MSKLGVLVAILAVAALLVIPTVVLAQPQVCGFYGSATIDGASVTNGTVVKAFIDQVEVKSVITTGSNYTMNIAGNYTGKTVSFKVGSALASATQTPLWEAGRNKPLNLTAVTAAPEPTGITLDPIQGTLTTVSGKGYTSGSAITLTWDGAAVATVPAAVTAGADGKFVAVITAPTSTAGNYVIRAADASAKSAQATFKVVAAEKPASAIKKVTVTALAAGAEATAQFNTDTGELTLGIPKGDKGDTGTHGAKGDIGAKGANGANGANGAQGDAGAAGKDGSSTLGLIAIIIAAIALVLTVIAIVKEMFPGRSRI